MLRVQTGVKTALARSVELMVVDKVRSCCTRCLAARHTSRAVLRASATGTPHLAHTAQVIAPLGALIKAMPTLKRQMDARRQALLGAPACALRCWSCACLAPRRRRPPARPNRPPRPPPAAHCRL